MRFPTTLCAALAATALAGCGGSGPFECTAANENAQLLSLARDWYLFQDAIPGTTAYQQLVSATFDPATYANPPDLLDAFTAAARARNEDRYWSYLLTKQQSQQYFQAGQSAGFGVGFVIPASGPFAGQIVISQVMRGSPADQAAFRRGDRVVAIGPSATTMVPVANLIADDTLLPALAGAPGTVLYFSVVPVGEAAAVTRSMARADYDLDPVVPMVLTSPGGRKVGYLILRTFVATADDRLRSAFATFNQQAVTDVVVDERYNGGGLLETARVLGSLLHPRSGDLMYSAQFNPRHTDQQWSENFAAESNGIPSLERVAFITTSGTASASELVLNTLAPYLGKNLAIVGDRTYGKPVGQDSFALGACQDELHLISFRLENQAGFGGYYDGLPDAAGAFAGTSCAADDDLTHQLGDPAESSTAQALAFIDGTPCAPITVPTAGATATAATGRLTAVRRTAIYPRPDRPSPAQLEISGLF